MSNYRMLLRRNLRRAGRLCARLGVCLVLCIVICTSGCGRKDEGGQAPGADVSDQDGTADGGLEPSVGTPAQPAPPSQPDMVAVTVNGQDIMDSELQRRVLRKS